MKTPYKILSSVAGCVILAPILYFAVHAVGPRYKVESDGTFYRVAEKTRFSYSLIPNHSPRISDHFVNQFYAYEETQELIGRLQKGDKTASWSSVSGPVNRDEDNTLEPVDMETIVPSPASKCIARSTKDFVVGKTTFRDILGYWWLYTGANPNDVNDRKNWKPAGN